MKSTPLFPLFLRADWNTTLGTWLATSEDQPDFVVQADRLDALAEKVRLRTADTEPSNRIEQPRSCKF